MIIVDGRTDEETLLELLATGTEDTEPDFKATVDLSRGSCRSVLEFVKDAISMGNLPSGGYLIIGPSLRVESFAQPARKECRMRLTVGDEVFDVQEVSGAPGSYRLEWITGQNPGYGFSMASSLGNSKTVEELTSAIRNFLAQVDPETGYIE